MKKILYVLPSMALLSSLLFISGCKKSTSPSSNNSSGIVNYLVASVTIMNGTSVTNVTTRTYDAQNRIIGVQYSNGTAPITYAYGSGTVTKTQGTAVTVFTLNSAGFAVSDNQGNSYTYDGNGYLTNITNTSGASTVNTISNGNIVSSVQTTSAGVSTTESYTFLSTLNTSKDGFTIMGVVNTNLAQSETIGTLVGTFSYTFDSKGRVQTEKLVSGASTSVETLTYEN